MRCAIAPKLEDRVNKVQPTFNLVGSSARFAGFLSRFTNAGERGFRPAAKSVCCSVYGRGAPLLKGRLIRALLALVLPAPHSVFAFDERTEDRRDVLCDVRVPLPTIYVVGDSLPGP